jgi:hypothetical protein
MLYIKMSVNSISGNQYFKQVRNLAGQISNLNVNNGQASEVTAGNMVQTSKGTVTTVLGYTPRTWSSKSANSHVSMVKTLNGTEASSSSLNSLVYIPPNSIVQKVRLIGTSATGMSHGNFAVGLAPLGADGTPNQAIASTLMAATSWEQIEWGGNGAIVGGQFTGATGITGVGQPYTDFNRAGITATGPNNYLTIFTDNVPSSVGMRVAVTYLNN